MMFGLRAACLAMYHTALPSRRAVVGGLLGSLALTSFLTGLTEPIEFTFIFLAPALYAVHALLSGVAFIVMNALDVRLGFSFSAGFIERPRQRLLLNTCLSEAAAPVSPTGFCMAGKFKHERYCDAAKFFFCPDSAYPSAMRTEASWLGSKSQP